MVEMEQLLPVCHHSIVSQSQTTLERLWVSQQRPDSTVRWVWTELEYLTIESLFWLSENSMYMHKVTVT